MRAKAELVSCLGYIWHFADDIGRKIDEINGKRRVWFSLIKALDDKAEISLDLQKVVCKFSCISVI